MRRYDSTLLALRAVLATVFIGHGGQKLFGWFGGEGLTAEIEEMGKRGLEPAGLLAVTLATSELGGGLLLLLGLLAPLGALAIAGVMVGAIAVVSGQNGFFIQNNGFEYNLVLIVICAIVGLNGAGTYSVDHAITSRKPGLRTLLRQSTSAANHHEPRSARSRA